MKRYWWVNHSQTFQQEIEGGWLWSPKKEKNGARSRFYDNMRRASPGDLVLSFAETRIGSIGEVTDYAIAARKPEFGGAGANWSDEGWLLPVSWKKLMLPVQPKAIINRLAPLLPAKYSPFVVRTGRGSQKAYLAEISVEVYEEVLKAAGIFTGRAVSPKELPGSSFEDIVEYLDELDEARVEADASLSATEREQLIKARKGQGDFRRDLCQIEQGCRITGVQNLWLLRASHIKPWRLCESSRERLDGCNGLLLAPHVDLLFDRGLFTVSETDRVILSPRVDRGDLAKWGLSDLGDRSLGAFRLAQRQYLNYHRESVFLNEVFESSNPSA